jgi:tight adherence protein B
MQVVVVGLIIFFSCVIILELLIYAFKNMRSPNRAKIRKRLRKHVYVQDEGGGGTDIMKKRIYSEIPFLNRLLSNTPGMQKLDQLVIQANAKYPMGFYILLVLLLATLGYIAGKILVYNQALALIFMVVFGTLPILFLKILKQRRLEKFQKQLPEALDLIARSLKAGHAFTGGMQMAAEEFDDPLGPEFSETLDEIKFGVSVSNAMKNLNQRIECTELGYFVIGVILQRETGGNLAELIETLANLIREKFKLLGKIRTLSAEGKLSAVILCALPFFITAWIRFTNPEYMNLLFTEPMGQVMVAIAVVLMILGVIVMKKMIDIKV